MSSFALLGIVGAWVGAAHASPRPRIADADPSAQPDRFAWELFTSLNRNASSPGNNNVVWETWASADQLYGNPNATPVWPGSGPVKPLRFTANIKQILHRSPPPAGIKVQSPAFLDLKVKPQLVSPHAMFLPSTPTQEEVRMDKADFDYVVANQFWYRQGLEAAFTKGMTIDFPTDAKEIKAVWKPITASQKPRFHWQKGSDGSLYGLVALHITSRALPNWVWATFEQIDNPQRGKILPPIDTFGLKNDAPSPELIVMMKAAGLGEMWWKNYRLDRCQIGYANPTLNGNSIIENGFVQTSSCMTCHARATVDGQGKFLSVFKPDGQSYNGVPDPKWYVGPTGKPIFAKCHFVWSLPLRAQPRTSSPK